MAADVDEADSTLRNEAPGKADGGAEQLGGLVDGQQLFHDRALLWREMGKRHVWVLHGCLPTVRGTISRERDVPGVVAPGPEVIMNRVGSELDAGIGDCLRDGAFWFEVT